MLNLRSSVILLILICIYSVCYADENTVFRNYTVEDGLYHSIVRDIIQDRFGFMWIATSEGLQRFDGRSFTYYGRSGQSDDLINNDIEKLYIPPNQDLLFIGCSNAILSVLNFQTGNFQNFVLDDLLPGEASIIISISHFSDSLYIIGTRTPGRLYCLDLKESKIKKIRCNLGNYSDEEPNSINDIYIDSDKKIWLATTFGLFKSNVLGLDEQFDNLDFKQISKIKNVNSILEWDNDHYSIVTDGDIFHLNINSYEIKNVTPNELKNITFRYHVKDNNGNIWVGTNNRGLIRINIASGNYFKCLHDPLQKNSLLNNNTEGIFFSNIDSILWVGSDRGISYLSTGTSSFKYFTPLTKQKEVIDYNFGYLVASDKTIWIYSAHHAYYSESGFDEFVRIFEYHKEFGFLGGKRVRDIYEDENNIIWFGTYDGLFSFDLRNRITCHFKVSDIVEHSSYYNQIEGLYKYGDSLWLATQGGIVLFSRSEKRFTTFPVPDNINLASKPLLSKDIVYDPEGYVWLGVDFDGVYKYNIKTKKYTHYIYNKEDEKSLSSNDFISIFRDSENDIWIATYTGGVNKYIPEDNSFERYTIKNKLPSNSVYAILEDENKNLWMSTNRGIVRLNKRTKEIDVFSFHDGIYIHEFNQGAFFKSPDGEMYFGGVGGVASFYPEDVLMNVRPPDIRLTDIYFQNKRLLTNSNVLNGKTLLYHDKISLKYVKATISIDVSLIEYLFPLRTNFAWKLLDYETDWNYSRKNQTSISYTNLPPGEYELVIKSTSDNSVWSKNPYTLKIEIIPPWWKSLWFRTVGILVILTAVFTFYNLRIFYLKKQRKYLNAQIAEKTEELKALNVNLEESNAEIKAQNDELEKYRHHLENIVLERTQELKEALEIAEESIEFKSAILRNMSHEIRTPLNAIVGYSQFLGSEDIDNEEKDQFIDIITKSSNSLTDVIENVMEISKLESKNHELREISFELNELIKETINDLIYKVKKDVELSFDTEIPANLICDKVKFRNILKQVISNAINYTEEGFIKVSYTVKTANDIQLPETCNKQLKSQEYVVVKVEDSGVGIPADQSESIYESFRKVESYKEKLFRGVGLGLSISKRLVEIMDGAIWHKSKIPGGTSFYFLIPFKEAVVKDQGQPIQSDQNIKGKNILIADDSLEWFNIVKLFLKKFDVNLFWANDGYKLLETVKNQEMDMIIIDIRMPNMDGFETMEKLKELKPDIDKIPVIALSGFEYTDIAEKIKSAGFDYFIQKPVSYNTFIEILNRYLGKPSNN